MSSVAQQVIELRERLHAAQQCRSPLVMGVLNVTPDSFSDGGLDADTDAAVARALAMVDAGADLIDIGGESTRPGAEEVSVDEELSRVLPVITRLSAVSDTLISIDTSKPEVMQAAVEAGAVLINDVRALTQPGALAMAVASPAMICLMHMQGQPASMQVQPHYDDVVGEVSDWLAERAQQVIEAGAAAERIVLDPGFGFGKTVAHNYQLLARLSALTALAYPVLAGLSRKSMLGAVTGRADPRERVAASVAGAVLAAQAGAALVRVHDVAETVDALAVWAATVEQQIH